MKPVYTALCLCLMLLLGSCAEEPNKKTDDFGRPEATGERTVLVYMAAENSLSLLANADIEEMKKGAKSLPDNMRLVVFLDLPDENSRLYRIDRSGMKEIKDYNENLVSTDVSTLQRVIADTEWKYPAREYGMVMWSHAKGWQPDVRTARLAVSRSFGEDDNAGTSPAYMDIPDLAEALRGFPKFRYILFDACFMQCIEVAYDLQDVTSYILGAPCEIPGTGAYYDQVVPALFSRDFAQELVDSYYKPYITENNADPGRGYGAVMAALDCSQVGHFTDVTKEVLPAYDASKKMDIAALQVYLAYNSYVSRTNGISPYYDLKGQMQQLLTAADYEKWEKALGLLIVAKGSTDTFFSSYRSPNITIDKDKFSGLAGYVPDMYPDCDYWDARFRTTSWYKAAGWADKGW